MSRAVPGAGASRAPNLLGGLLLAALAGGCFKGEVGDLPAEVVTHPDPNCNTAQDAAANAECRLTLGKETQEYIQQQGDKDWWVVNVGALPARAIVHVVAGYKPGAGQDAGSFNTAVNFQINVLDSANGAVSSSILSAVDKHGSNPPTVLDLTFRYTKSNNDLYLLVQDDNGKKFDNLSPYTIKVEVVQDPDANEPNDTPATATPIPLAASGGGVQGSSGGFISTPGDLDYYSIASPNPNSVMWIRVGQDPAFPSPPPHRYRLEYFLRDPGGTVIATDSSTAGSQFSQALVQVGTARLLQTGGTYTLEVRAYIDPNNQTVIPPGDLNFKYKVEIIIVPLQDPSEPNNTIADAKAKPSPDLTLAAPGSSGPITGRISFVPDPDYYRVRLAAATAGPTLLHYKVTPSNAPARFPPVPGAKDRILTVTTEVPAGSQSACAAGDAGVCIISAAPDNYNYPIATNLCQSPTPQCMQSARYENHDPTPLFPNLANFEAVLQVPPNAANTEYFFKFEDEGNNWADDTDYTIQVDWLPEPDGAEAVPDPQRPATMAAGRASTPLSGYLSYGIGATDTSLGIAPITDAKDYDGRGDDVDTFAVAVPASVATEAQLFFQWRIPSASVNQLPYDLGIRLGFCVPDGGVACSRVQTRTQSGGSQLGLIYDTGSVASWWNTARPPATPLESAYDRSYAGTPPTGQVLTVFRDYACGCLESRLIAPGGGATMFVSVFPINRQTWVTNIPYTVETGYGAYPYPASGSVSCPTPCGFTR